MATNVWNTNDSTGDFTTRADWSLDRVPVSGIAEIIGGAPTLDGGDIGGFTLDINASSDELTAAALGLTDATLDAGMVVEDTGSTNQQEVLDASASLAITSTVTNNGTLLLNAVIDNGDLGFALNFLTETATLINNGTISVGVDDGLQSNDQTFTNNGTQQPYGTLINNGLIDYAATTDVSSFGFNDPGLQSPITGSGTIAVINTSIEIGPKIDLNQTIAFTDATSAIGLGGRLAGADAGFLGTIEGFQPGDFLIFPDTDLTDSDPGHLNGPSISFDQASRELTLLTSFGADTLELTGPFNYTTASFFPQTYTSAITHAIGFEIGTTAAACFAAGTRIGTRSGEVAVEDLATGDYVCTHEGGLSPVRWVGHRHVVCARHPRPWDVLPVRVAAGAFGRGRPWRDLLLSPDHAVFCDGVLIPIRRLMNGASVAQIEVREVTYFHVELPAHAVLFAEGLPAESFLDTGNRTAFANGGPGVHLHPDFARRVWRERGCADLIETGPTRDAVWQRLREQAGALGHDITNDPAVRLSANGRAVPMQGDGSVWRFSLPASAAGVQLTSRSAVPAHFMPDSVDHRRLGIAISRLSLDGDEIGLTDARLGAGWHDVELDSHWRWTDGCANLDIDGRHRLDVEIAMSQRYWVHRAVRRRRRGLGSA